MQRVFLSAKRSQQKTVENKAENKNYEESLRHFQESIKKMPGFWPLSPDTCPGLLLQQRGLPHQYCITEYRENSPWFMVFWLTLSRQIVRFPIVFGEKTTSIIEEIYKTDEIYFNLDDGNEVVFDEAIVIFSPNIPDQVKNAILENIRLLEQLANVTQINLRPFQVVATPFPPLSSVKMVRELACYTPTSGTLRPQTRYLHYAAERGKYVIEESPSLLYWFKINCVEGTETLYLSKFTSDSPSDLIEKAQTEALVKAVPRIILKRDELAPKTIHEIVEKELKSYLNKKGYAPYIISPAILRAETPTGVVADHEESELAAAVKRLTLAEEAKTVNNATTTTSTSAPQHQGSRAPQAVKISLFLPLDKRKKTESPREQLLWRKRLGSR